MLIEREKKIIPEESSANIKDLDPLHADLFMIYSLPILNNAGRLDDLMRISSYLVPGESQIAAMNNAEANAGLRDLGIMAASVKRHGGDIGCIPNLESAMIALGSKLGEPPRDTIFHYVKWNPEGERRRMFTGTSGEELFIQSLDDGMTALDGSVDDLMSLRQKPVTDADFVRVMDTAREKFQNMINGMVDVRNNITPDFFSSNIRPYFPDLTIGGQDYAAPGGAQMPILLVDRILWASDVGDTDYQNFYAKNLSYMPKPYREIGAVISGESIVSRLANEKGAVDLSDSKRSAVELLNSLLKFRYPHLKAAKDNFRVRAEGSKGSGGYDAEILKKIIKLTHDAKDRLQY
jgi:monodechloroaminopyrrolnitrin synthase